MRFQLFGALQQLAGSDFDVPLEQPAKLGELLGPLSARLGKLVPYGTGTTEAQLMSNLSFFRNGRLLRMTDQVAENDIILVVLPATGG